MSSWFYIKNHSSAEQFPLASPPWEVTVKPIPQFLAKAQYRKWCLDEKTDHVFFTGIEPVDPHTRVSGENPPLKIHGLVADWDSATEFSEILKRIATVDVDLRPSYLCRTFSGNLRGLWRFSEPVWADCEETSKQFVRLFFDLVKARSLTGGFDDASLGLQMVWDVGTNWIEVPDHSPTPKNVLEGLRVDAIKRVKKVKEGNTDIPLDAIAAEIEHQFPGRLFGAKIEQGNRIPLFWLPADSKKKDRSAIVAPWGVYAFSSRAGKGRFFWDEILGKEFVRKFQEARVGEGSINTYYDGRQYWWKVQYRWVCRTKDDIVLKLKNTGFNSTRKEGETASEVEQVLYAIQQGCVIDGAAPFVFTTEELVKWNGKTFLNTNTRRPMKPSPEGTGNPENFPWLHEYLSNVLDRAPEDFIHPKEFLLAELQRAYRSIMNSRPTSGHFLIFAGPSGRGKSLLTTVIMRKIFGSAADAGTFLVEGREFNKDLAESFIWFIDDNKSTTSITQHKNFSESIKKIVATPEVVYRAMWNDGIGVPWYGRVMIGCNDDPDSISIIPDLDITIRDKVSLFKVSQWQAKFLDNVSMSELLDKELPYFLRWLLDVFVVPEEIDTPDEPRYGLLTYHHPELIDTARESSSQNRLAEVLNIWRRRIGGDSNGSLNFETREDRTYWCGTATELLSSLYDFEEVAPLIRSYTPVSFGRAVAALWKTGTYRPLSMSGGHGPANTKKSSRWFIELPSNP